MSSESDFELMLQVAALADYTTPFAVGAVATLGIAEFFQEARSVDSVALQAGLDAGALQRLMRTLVARGFFSEPQPGVFFLEGPAQLLLDVHPYSLREAYALFPADVNAWAHIRDSLRTGESAFEHVHRQSLWDYLSQHPNERTRFDRSMEALSRLEMLWLLEAYDWNQFATVVDIGGGVGTTLVALLKSFPALNGVVFDLPPVVALAGPLLREARLTERCRLEAGDFFSSVPAGHDAYLLKRIIYSYDDAEAARILQNVRGGMRDDSRILLLEPVKRKGAGFDYGKLLDMQMLILGGGRVRNRAELRTLLKTASLRLRRIIPTPMTAVVEAVPE